MGMPSRGFSVKNILEAKKLAEKEKKIEKADSKTALIENVVAAHKEEYGCEPESIAQAPGRIHMIGEHTWFFKDKTLTMAVNIPVFIAVSRRSDANLHFSFVQFKEKKKCSLSALKVRKEDKWANALKSVVYGFNSSGFECSGVDFTVYSDVLPSAGFGITTAMKVAAAWALKDLFKFRVKDETLVQILLKSDRNFLGLDNTLADIFSVVYSKENNIVLTDHSKGTYELLPFKFKNVTVVLTDTSVPRVMTWNEDSLMQPENVLLLGELKEPKSSVFGGWSYDDRSAEKNEVLSVVSEDVRRHLTCIMNEHRYVLEVQSALEKVDFTGFARAVNRSHEGLRDLYDISCPEIDWLLKRVLALGGIEATSRSPLSCGRITGKGFGRCTYSVIRNSDMENYNQVLQEYERIFGFKATCTVVKPSRGVRLV